LCHNRFHLRLTLANVVTNAAGGLNQDYAVGDIVLLNDVCNPAVFKDQAVNLTSTSTLLVS
jgi:purine nucleoside phosphorylase